ncbi:hypothetical protein E2542_SST16757 [Spatholobus suberectus]|nr:hypothetical protein E2542_SST16757 [Spatholobus suberectus]
MLLIMHNLLSNSLHQMESAICLRYYPFPYGSKGVQGARPSRFHLRFNHATPLCVPHLSTTRSPVARSFRHATCMLERFSAPSQNERSGNKILRGVTGVSLVLACVLGLFNFSGKMNPKFTTAYAGNFDSSKFSRIENPRKAALEELLEMINANYENIKERDQSNNIDDLKMLAIVQSKSGNKEDKALKILEKRYNDCKKNPSLPKESESELEQNLAMALAEVYMFQEIRKARELLDEQIDNELESEKLNPEEKYDRLSQLYNSRENAYEKCRIAKLILYKAIVDSVTTKKNAGIWPKYGKLRTAKGTVPSMSHSPSRGDVSSSSNEIHISENLNHFQQAPSPRLLRHQPATLMENRSHKRPFCDAGKIKPRKRRRAFFENIALLGQGQLHLRIANGKTEMVQPVYQILEECTSASHLPLCRSDLRYRRRLEWCFHWKLLNLNAGVGQVPDLDAGAGQVPGFDVNDAEGAGQVPDFDVNDVKGAK